jgi:hypothetical protein
LIVTPLRSRGINFPFRQYHFNFVSCPTAIKSL